MSKIEIGRWSEQLRRQLGMKGQEIVAAELSSEVSPTIQLEGDAAEWRFLKSVRDAGSAARLAAAATFFGRFRLRNPPGSGVIAQVDYLEIEGSAAANYEMARGTETTDLAVGLIDTMVFDQRWQTSGLPSAAALLFSTTNLDTTLPEGRTFVRAPRIARTPLYLRSQIVLPPGASLDWGCILVNLEVQTSFAWHERQLPRLEA